MIVGWTDESKPDSRAGTSAVRCREGDGGVRMLMATITTHGSTTSLPSSQTASDAVEYQLSDRPLPPPM